MRVHLTGELETKLLQAAARQSRNPDDLVQEVLITMSRRNLASSRLCDEGMKLCSEASTSPTNRLASVSSGFYSSDAGPLGVS
jgi:hypothetical protein